MLLKYADMYQLILTRNENKGYKINEATGIIQGITTRAWYHNRYSGNKIHEECC